MSAQRDDHLDEGTIHAWLDGALDAESAGATEAHALICADCGAMVAEARGLIAGASRVVGALDDVPADVVPAWGRSTATPSGGSLWRWLRVTPARAAIAATVLVAAGITLTRERVAVESSRVNVDTVARETAPGAPDHLLDSAVARSVAASQPPRSLQAAPGMSVPASAPAASPTIVADPSVGERVAIGRAAVRAERDSVGVEADKLRAGAVGAVGGTPGVPSASARAMMAAKVADSSRSSAQLAARTSSAFAAGSPVAGDCYRVESVGQAASVWGGVRLPFVLALEGAPSDTASVMARRGARIYEASGVSPARALWTRGEGDSVRVDLQQSGFRGTIALALGTEAGARAGVARWEPEGKGMRVAPFPVVARRVGCPQR